MNARLPAPFGRLLCPSYDHHGLKLDLYGALDDDGYSVQHVCIPGTTITMTECVDSDLMDFMSAKLDDTLPSAEELRKELADEARVERAAMDRAMNKYPQPMRAA
jgi:hypothetical protein